MRVPGRAWEKTPASGLARVVEKISEWEIAIPKDLMAFKTKNNLDAGETPEYAAMLGPLPDRGPPSGLVVAGGRIVAEWGAPARADAAFSVGKGAAAILTGVALTDGLIGSIDDPVVDSVRTEHFASRHNRQITWRHLLNFTSEWRGFLWGIPDSIEWNRAVPARPDALPKGGPRDVRSPGQYWEYNDVRGNLLTFALTWVFRKALSEVLRERVMVPIGGSDRWAWHGYNGAEIETPSGTVPVVAISGHWGGGLAIGADDLARLGLLAMGDGTWEGRRILPHGWTDRMRQPGPLHPAFSLMWWSNAASLLPFAPPRASWASGIGNFMLLDPERELVIVLRWFPPERRDEILTLLIEGLGAQ